jgi:phosphatidylglycerophosphatase C
MSCELSKVYVFDFDGTLTTHDSLLAFIRYAKGTWQFVFGFLLYSPLLLLMKLHLYNNGRMKERIFSYFFSGMNINDFDNLCDAFARDCRNLIRLKAIEYINLKVEEDAQVMIVSASIDNWVKPFTAYFNKPITIVGTCVEVKDNRLTGRFTTRNCYGMEKVERIKALLPSRESYELIAFGDSRGDKEMLKEADKGYFKPFK